MRFLQYKIITTVSTEQPSYDFAKKNKKKKKKKTTTTKNNVFLQSLNAHKYVYIHVLNHKVLKCPFIIIPKCSTY